MIPHTWKKKKKNFFTFAIQTLLLPVSRFAPSPSSSPTSCFANTCWRQGSVDNPCCCCCLVTQTTLSHFAASLILRHGCQEMTFNFHTSSLSPSLPLCYSFLSWVLFQTTVWVRCLTDSIHVSDRIIHYTPPALSLCRRIWTMTKLDTRGGRRGGGQLSAQNGNRLIRWVCRLVFNYV